MTKEETPRKSIGARRNPESAEAILEAAYDLLLQEGYSGFSIEAVARRARAGKPTIYRWWPSKAALLLDVYQRQKREVEYGDSGSLEEDMFRLVKSLLRHWRETPSGNIFRSLIAEAQSDETAAKALADYARERRAATGQMVRRAIEAGEVSPDTDPEVVADLLASYAWVHLLTGRLDEEDGAIRKAVACIARGVLADPPRG